MDKTLTKTQKDDSLSKKKLKAFLSYSRKDLVFVDRLQTALEKQGIEVFLNRENIEKGEDWWKRIQQLIMESDTTVFILSPNSVDSSICKKEVDHAEKLKKRILPVVAEDIGNHSVPEALARLEYTFFIKNPTVGASGNFDEAVLDLVRVLKTDIDWIREHTRIGTIAQRWDKQKLSKTYLLRGEELSLAENWLTTRPKEAPDPTDLHIEFITRSRQADMRKKRIITLFSILVALMAIGLSGIAYFQRSNALKAQAETKEQLRKNYWANALDSKERNDLLGLLHYSAKATGLASNRSPFKKNALYNINNYMAIFLSHMFEHDDYVSSAVFSQGKARLLTERDDGTVRLWDVIDGSPIGESMKHNRPVRGVVFNQDGTRILTWSSDGKARLWDARDGAPIGESMKQNRPVRGVVFNQDGTRILTWSSDGKARLWDTSDGSSIGKPIMHDSYIKRAVFNHDGTRILTWSYDGTVRLLDATDGSSIGKPMKYHDGTGDKAVFNRDGTRILTWSGDGTVRLWDATDGSSIGKPMKHHDGTVADAVFNKDETRILTRTRDRTARLWGAVDGSAIGPRMKHYGYVKGAVFDQNGTRILTWSSDGRVRLWDASDGSSIGQPMKHHDRPVTGAVFNQDGTRILTWSDRTGARLWDATDGSSIGHPMSYDRSVRRALFNQDETQILTWSSDGTVQLWDATDGSSIGQPIKNDTETLGAVFNPDGTRILTWSEFGTAKLWDIEVDEDFPKEHLSLMVRVATGTSMDDYGNIITLKKNEWEQYKTDYIRVAEEHIKTCTHKNVNIYLKYQKPNWDKK